MGLFGVEERKIIRDMAEKEKFAEHAIELLNKDLKGLSKRCKKIAANHTKEKSQKRFRTAFYKMC